MNLDLFPDASSGLPEKESLGPGALLLRGRATALAGELLDEVAAVEAHAPFRHMVTPGGWRMSVALTNCGTLGWTSDRRGYRYARLDPETGEPWPPMPPAFLRLAQEAAAEAGFDGFTPDACLVNRYLPGTRLSLHQDKDEHDFSAPIVSVSLGVSATFLFGGMQRGDKPQRIGLAHGDVLVWGGPDRLRFHGILPVADAFHPATGTHRINLTFRKAG